MIEMLVAFGLFLLIAFAVYRVFSQYSGSYVRTDDRLESVTEAWQVLRTLREDLAFADLPEGDPTRWAHLVQADTGGFGLVRRNGASRVAVFYRWDRQTGNLRREEEGGRQNSLLQARCLGLDVGLGTWPEGGSLPAGQIPQRIWFTLRLELGQPVRRKDMPSPFVLETTVLPVMANQSLHRRFPASGFSP
ncbi:MAG: hypothetical protein GX442_04430 [Candidatus Riflebacteria bacterium]|nr:hypothetical protein [Candidatus Riflebacteria bacterium]